MKELKPDKYKSLKQTIVLKNKIDTVAGQLMINEITDAQLAAESTDSVTYSVNDGYEFYTRQYNERQDNLNKWHTLADSIVAVHMKTFTKHFTLQTPLAGNYSATVQLSGKEYKIASQGLSWDDVINSTSSGLVAQNKIMDNAQVYTTDWTGSSANVNFESGRVNMFAWFKEAKTVNWTTRYVGPNDSYYTSNIVSSDFILTQWLGERDWYAENDPNCTLDASKTTNTWNRPSQWTMINDEGANGVITTPIMFPNPYKVETTSGVWKNQPMYLGVYNGPGTAPLSTEYENGKPFSGQQETMVAQSIPIKERYKFIKVTVVKTDLLGYEFDVTVEYPSKYVYLAGSRGCKVAFFGSLYDWYLIDSIGFVDVVNQLNIKLYGEAFDESNEEYSVQLDNYGTPVAGSGNHIKRLSNNELLTKGARVVSALNGKIAYRQISWTMITIQSSDYDHNTGEYSLSAEFDWDPVTMDLLKRDYELGLVDVELYPNYGATFVAGDIYEVTIDFGSPSVVTIKGISPMIIPDQNVRVYVNALSEDTFTGSWKNYAAKLLINLYKKGRAVINVDVDASFMMGEDALKINDWIKVKDIHNNWIIRNGQIAYFEVKNIRKIYEKDQYRYQITAIESGYGEFRIESIKLVGYTDYTLFDGFNSTYISYPIINNETGEYLYLAKNGRYNIYIINKSITENYITFTLVTFATPPQARSVEYIDIDTVGGAIEILDVTATSRTGGYDIVVEYNALEGTTTDFDLKAILIKSDPEDQIIHNTPWIKSSYSAGGPIDSGAALVLTTSQELEHDAGYITLDEPYDENNDYILFVMRCPVWSFGHNPVDKLNSSYYDFIEKAGYVVRYDLETYDDVEHLVTLNFDGGTAKTLEDSKGLTLYDNNDQALLVSVSEETNNINFYGLYALVLVKPTAEQLRRGISPFIIGSTTVDMRLSEETWGQGQFYHIKGAVVKDLETLWKELLKSGELNNYHGTIYPLPSVPDDD